MATLDGIHASVWSGAGPKIEWAEAGAGREKNTVEREVAWAGATERGVSGELKFRPLPLICSAVQNDVINVSDLLELQT